MKVFVTGVAGQLGYDVARELVSRHFVTIGSDIAVQYDGAVTGMEYLQMDITDEDSVKKILTEGKPDVVIHCAAWTAVDDAEDEKNLAKVRSVNVDGTLHIAKACKEIAAKMVYISTDYVFGGDGEEPWEPDCKTYSPLNVYGKTKLEGEQAVCSVLDQYFIIRIAWVFGIHGRNFVKTMLDLGKTHERLTVVSDQVGTPTYTPDLARLIVDMIETEKYGYYHATNEGGYISWCDFAVEIFRQAAAKGHREYTAENLAVVPVTTAQYGSSKARRPFNSRLSRNKIISEGFQPLPPWQDALGRYLDQIL